MISSSVISLAILASLTGSVDPVVLNVVRHIKSPALIRTIECESAFQQYQEDGSLLMGEHGEVGIAQFKQETWDWMNGMRGTNLNIENALAQLNMMEWAFAHNLQSHWTCYNNLK